MGQNINLFFLNFFLVKYQPGKPPKISAPFNFNFRNFSLTSFNPLSINQDEMFRCSLLKKKTEAF